MKQPFELPSFYVPHPARLNPHLAQARKAINGYVQQLRDWMAGVLKWHQLTQRYDESRLATSSTSNPSASSRYAA